MSEGAEWIYYNGEIISMDKKNTIYEAIAIKKERIIAIGKFAELKKWSDSNTKFVDLEEKTVLPGLIDAHQHLFHSGFNLLYIHCSHPSIKEMVEEIHMKSKELEPDEWIIGWGYDEANFQEKRHPETTDFKDIKNPIYISRYCEHTAVVNKTVLQLMKLTKETTVKNGEIVRNDDGEAIGVLKEEAMQLAKQVIPAYTKEQMKEAIKLAINENLSKGITSVHDAGLGFFSGSFEQEYMVLKEMAENKELSIRIYGMVLEKFFQKAIKKQKEKNGYFRIGAMKLFADGTISGKTAAISIDYNETVQSGMLLYTEAELTEKVMAAHKLGYQIAIHAIGDRAVEQVIQAYDKALQTYPRSNHRHRIEHSMITNKALLKKMKALEIIPILQPALVYQAGDVYQENLDSTLSSQVFAAKKMMDHHLSPAGSSDAPITPGSPFFAIYAAMSRKTKRGKVLAPENKITLDQALKMYTINAARASFDEANKGTLEVGKLGDMTIVPKGFMHFEENKIKDTKVLMTVIGGEIMYKRGQGNE
ncbi:amidohydrolase [Niallia sp. NCCP-28]|uniref:amidohydrolase n=1 Tax=Niallia sp. NCCP-28 TaxID=2934712 RepID=UPI002082F1D2|nr:amidohydrolase [Niallia sp. NCCP-28]GKU82175.1 exoenzyme regulatory protein aepA precursor [Niallia sp. NCCP-28]